MKVSELTGPLLDYWVAKALGLSTDYWVNGQRCSRVPLFIDCPRQDPEFGDIFTPSERWDHGGPIIELKRIALICSRPRHNTNEGEHWDAVVNGDYVGPDGQVESRDRQGSDGEGPTALTAAMRAVVASEYGSEVPDAPT